MRRLDRYIIRELIVPFLIGTVAVVLMFQANQLIFVLKSFQLQNVPTTAVFQSILYKTPNFLSMTLPVGMSLAASLSISRLTRESELTAMRACGTRILRVIMPVAFFGLLVAAGNFYIVERVMPQSEREFRRVATQIGILGAAPSFRANAVIYLKGYTATFGSVSRSTDDALILSDILLFESPRAGERWYYEAKRGEYRNGVWTLNNALIRVFKGDDVISIRPAGNFTINERITVGDIFESASPEERSLDELRRAIAEGKRSKRNTTMDEVAFHVRFSMPAACLIFAVVAPVFAVYFARAQAFVGVLLSIILVMLYYNAYIISTEVLGRNEIVSPFLAAWLPNFIFLAFGLVAIRRLE